MATNKADEIPTPPTREQLLMSDEHYTEPAPPPPPSQPSLNLGATADLQHSGKMGGSSAAQRVNCPGSMALEAKMPPGESSEYADQGSVLHAVMEQMLTAVDPDADDYEQQYRDFLEQCVGQHFEYDEQFAVTPEHVKTKVMPAWHAFISVLNEYNLDDWFIEQRVALDSVIPGAFGTVDLLAVDTAGRMHVLDWKFGDGVVVPVEGNMQLLFYAACALYDEDPEVMELLKDVKEVVLHVVQPRVGDNTALHSWPCTVADVETFIDQAAEAMDKATKPNPPIKAGSHCRWCTAKPICPAHKNAAIDALSKTPESMTATELADALNKATLLKSWIADVFTLAQREMETGASVPGYKLVQKRPTRQWTDPEAAEKALRSRKVKVGDMFTRKLISPTQLEKLNDQVYAAIADDLVIMKSSGVTVAPDSDKREAVVDSFALLGEAMDGIQ